MAYVAPHSIFLGIFSERFDWGEGRHLILRRYRIINRKITGSGGYWMLRVIGKEVLLLNGDNIGK